MFSHKKVQFNNKPVYKQGMHMLLKRWELVIDNDGNYIINWLNIFYVVCLHFNCWKIGTNLKTDPILSITQKESNRHPKVKWLLTFNFMKLIFGHFYNQQPKLLSDAKLYTIMSNEWINQFCMLKIAFLQYIVLRKKHQYVYCNFNLTWFVLLSLESKTIV